MLQHTTNAKSTQLFHVGCVASHKALLREVYRVHVMLHHTHFPPTCKCSSSSILLSCNISKSIMMMKHESGPSTVSQDGLRFSLSSPSAAFAVQPTPAGRPSLPLPLKDSARRESWVGQPAGRDCLPEMRLNRAPKYEIASLEDQVFAVRDVN